MKNISDYNGIIENIREIIKDARKRVARNVNIELIATIGKLVKQLQKMSKGKESTVNLPDNLFYHFQRD